MYKRQVYERSVIALCVHSPTLAALRLRTRTLIVFGVGSQCRVHGAEVDGALSVRPPLIVGGPGRPSTVVEFLVINFSVCLVLLSNCHKIIYCIVWFQVQPFQFGSISYTVITYCCISMIFATH